MLLAGDIGGSKVDLAVYERSENATHPLFEATLKSDQFTSLEEIVRIFLKSSAASVSCAVFGLAGPVVRGKGRITNLSWEIDENQLQKALGLERLCLLNDLQAMAYAIPSLPTTDLQTLHVGQVEAGGAIAIIAPGTGLGEAFLLWDGERYIATPSEGGHADFAPINALQTQLLLFLLNEFPHVSYERVCSGIGLPNIYRFLKAIGYAEEPEWLADKISRSADPTPIIVDAAAGEENCTLYEATIELFSSILGAECGNLALRAIATGGVFIAGGMLPKMMTCFSKKAFLEAYTNKGRLSDFVGKIQVQVVLNPKLALIGAAQHGIRRWPKQAEDLADRDG